MFLLVISEILGLFVNTLTADDKYSLHNTEALWHPIQMQLPRKQKIFLVFSFSFETYIKFRTFSKNNDSHSSCISQVTNSERRGYINV